MEEQLRDREIAELKTLEDALSDNSPGSNPLFEFIEQCEFLRKYCQKQIKDQVEDEEGKQEMSSADLIKNALSKELDKASSVDQVKQVLKNELDKKLEKGSVALHNKEDGALFTGTQKIGGKKNKKAREGADAKTQ